MPPKLKNSRTKVQTTLSKFFASSSDIGAGSSSKADVIIDLGDDFQVVEDVKPNKRPKTDSTERVLQPKKLRTHKQVVSRDDSDMTADVQEDRTRVHSNGCATISAEHSPEGSKTDINPTPSTSTSSKLKEFEYMESSQSDQGCEFKPRSRGVPEVSAKNESELIELDSCDSKDEDKILASSSSQQPGPSSSSRIRLEQASSWRRSQSNVNQDKQRGNEKIKYTPLEQQFVEIKSQHPDTVLFVECGYKYRFFGEDAEIAAKVLKIFCHMDHNFMTASIPVHRLFVHLRRVVAAGYKAGVVKQTETANLKAAGDNKSGPFTRKLSALYTKSTLIGEDVEPMSGCEGDTGQTVTVSHYLMCVYQEPTVSAQTATRTGMMCIDPATGDVVYDDFQDSMTCSELETRIAHLQPVEILISSQTPECMENFIRDIATLSAREDDRMRVENLDHDIFSPTQAVGTISQFYSKDQAGLQQVLNLPKPVISCLAALCVYLKDFQLDRLLTLTSNFARFSERSHFLYMSSACLRNLEVFNNLCDGAEKGSLFWVINHTTTKFGARLLRKWLTQPLLDVQEIQSRLDAVEELLGGTLDGLKNLRDAFTKLPDLERGLCSILHKKCSPLEFCTVTRALERVRKALHDLHLTVNSTLLHKLVSGIPEYLDDVKTYSNQINEKAARENDKANLFANDSQFPVVSIRKKEIDDVLSAIHNHRKEVRLTLGQPGLNYVTVLQTEFLVEVKNSQLKSVPSSWTQISSTKAVSRFHTPFLVQQYRRLKELREQLTLDVNSAWQDFIDQFSCHFVRYKTAVTYLATLDCLMALAKTASQGDFCKPEIDNARLHLDIQGGRHPIIDALSQGQEQFVPNDTSLDADGMRVMVISGPNMGGKSSYIRQVALISILAQIGSFVPAESASLGVLDGIHIRMGAADEIFKGRSTFMVELQEAGEIMHQASDNSLVILDELGRGTSTHDGVAIAHATLEYFITQCKCLVLFVTHFPMLSEFHHAYPTTVENFHMAFLLNDDNTGDVSRTDALTFLYQLTQGAAEKSYGLNVARLAELSSEIVQRAARKSQELEGHISNKIRCWETFVSLYKTHEERIKAALKEAFANDDVELS